MKLKAVLFDLDGTLLPMDQDVFLKAYFNKISARMAPYGYDPKALVSGIWQGTMAVIANDGKKLNRDVFWEAFNSLMGKDALADSAVFDAFYQDEFDSLRDVCSYNPAAKRTVEALKDRGLTVALATNPIFPSIATQKRMMWAGFEPSDFSLYTTYENSHFCKPNPEYYKEVAAKLGIQPEECLMVGNDTVDDAAAEKAGMKFFLLSDCLINKIAADISAYPSGSFDELEAYIKKIT